MASDLKITEQKKENFTEVVLNGEVDIYTSQSLKDKLYSIIDSSGSHLKIECSELNYIDSTGLGIFVGALKKARQFDKNIYILNLKDNIKKLFLITGLDKLFIIE